MAQKCDPKALGYAGAVLAALGMLLFGVFGYAGVYTGAVAQMQQWHMFFSVDPVGIILGMIEAAIWMFVALYVLAWLYNYFSK